MYTDAQPDEGGTNSQKSKPMKTKRKEKRKYLQREEKQKQKKIPTKANTNIATEDRQR
jgi:hypothetical protein